jgi:hypothetical protein
MDTAADDGRIKRNPCRIKGAGQHLTPERPTATVAQVYRLASLVPSRFRVLVPAAALALGHARGHAKGTCSAA